MFDNLELEYYALDKALVRYVEAAMQHTDESKTEIALTELGVLECQVVNALSRKKQLAHAERMARITQLTLSGMKHDSDLTYGAARVLAENTKWKE